MTKRRPPAALLLTSLCLILLMAVSSCSLDYTQAFPEDLADTIPDTVVYNFRHTVVQDGAIRFVLEAEKAETWEKSGRITMKGVSFTEYSARPEAGGARPEAGGA
ncbi:MAG: hypothetical protein KKI09_07395, partial [Spirochaetes bacterium]|nr:hypothetical protein [Spirochaetota bacterium]